MTEIIFHLCPCFHILFNGIFPSILFFKTISILWWHCSIVSAHSMRINRYEIFVFLKNYKIRFNFLFLIIFIKLLLGSLCRSLFLIYSRWLSRNFTFFLHIFQGFVIYWYMFNGFVDPYIIFMSLMWILPIILREPIFYSLLLFAFLVNIILKRWYKVIMMNFHRFLFFQYFNISIYLLIIFVNLIGHIVYAYLIVFFMFFPIIFGHLTTWTLFTDILYSAFRFRVSFSILVFDLLIHI